MCMRPKHIIIIYTYILHCYKIKNKTLYILINMKKKLQLGICLVKIVSNF